MGGRDMSLSSEHEKIVDDFRSAFLDWRNKLIKSDEKHYGNNLIIEQCIARGFRPDLPSDIRPDAYLSLIDVQWIIYVEVGKMRDGKWGDSPVLRIGFDRCVYLIHPQNSRLEKSLMKHLNRKLYNIIRTQDSATRHAMID